MGSQEWGQVFPYRTTHDNVQKMARPLRLEYKGALYHVTSRGDRREDIKEWGQVFPYRTTHDKVQKCPDHYD